MQGKFRTSANGFDNPGIDLRDLLKVQAGRMMRGVREEEDGQPYNDKIQKMIDRLAALRTDLLDYEIKVVFLAEVRRVSESQLRQLCDGLDVQVVKAEDLYRDVLFPLLSGSCHTAEEIRVEMSLRDKHDKGRRISSGIKTQAMDCSVLVVYVPTEEIGRVMSRYKNAILKYNPRCYLGLQRAANQEIEASMRELETNEFALYNNGITFVADDAAFTDDTFCEDVAVMKIVNPQIVNGGQTAYTLAHIYEEGNRAVFEGKEVLVKVISLGPDMAGTPDANKLIESLSRATNQQTAIKAEDRVSNHRLMVRWQQEIFNHSGYFFERKKGEYGAGIEQGFLDKDKIIDKEVLMRVAVALGGNPSNARRQASNTLFTDDNIKKLFVGDNYRLYLYGWFCIRYLNRLANTWRREHPFDRFGIEAYGQALRYGRYAVAYAASGLHVAGMPADRLEEHAIDSVKKRLEKWLEFEKWAIGRKENENYLLQGTDSHGDPMMSMDFDNYYKGRTVNGDVEAYFLAD